MVCQHSDKVPIFRSLVIIDVKGLLVDSCLCIFYMNIDMHLIFPNMYYTLVLFLSLRNIQCIEKRTERELLCFQCPNHATFLEAVSSLWIRILAIGGNPEVILR